MEEFSFNDAAKMLGIDVRTLRQWIKYNHTKTRRSNTDRRMKIITYDQILDLAVLHGRRISQVPPQRANLDLRVENELLRRRVSQLEHKFESLRLGIPERVLRVASGAPPELGPRVDDVHTMIVEAMRLVNEAGHEVIPRSREIFITFQSRYDLFDLAPSLASEWQQSLMRAMERGWRVAHLIRETNELTRSLAIAEDILRLLSGPRGAYVPLYTSTSLVPLDSHMECVLVPGVGALDVRISPDGTSLSSHRLQPSDAQYVSAFEWIRQLKVNNRPIIESYPVRSVRFSKAIVDAERSGGHRVLAMNGLSELTMRTDILTKRVERLLRDGDPEIQRKALGLLRTHRDREDVFAFQALRWDYRDLCPLETIRDYMHTGWHAEDDAFRAIGADKVPPELRAQHIRDVIRRLNDYPNYQLGLLREGTYDPALLRTFWLVKQSSVVLLEAQPTEANGKSREVDLKTTEKRLVDAFYECFYRLWNNATTDGTVVKPLLEAMISEIPFKS